MKLSSILTTLVVVFFLLFTCIFAVEPPGQLPGDNWDYVPANNAIGIKFYQGTKISRQIIDDSIMVCGIPSLDSLNNTYLAKSIKKVARDYPSSDPASTYYIITFYGEYEDMEPIVNAYKFDPHIEVADYAYTNSNVYWEPSDYLYNKSDVNWPIPGQDCEGVQTGWGNVWAEQAVLKNDGYNPSTGKTITINPNYSTDPNNPYLYITENAVEGEDINIAGPLDDPQKGWQYYLENTPSDPNGIPGDPGTIISHFDTGLEWWNPDIKNNIWFNEAENHGDPSFDPNIDYDPEHGLRGDKGSPTMADGVPGLVGEDDPIPDGADWFDPGIQEMIWNHTDDDGDGHSYDEPGGIHADCPIQLVLSHAVKEDGTEYTMDDIGIPGVDDDGDGYIDECDGAMWDDDENGYANDVIGWNFLNNNNDVSALDPHGAQTALISVATANNNDDATPPSFGNCDNIIDFRRIRVGMAGVCPDCRIMELKYGDWEGTWYALKMGSKIGVRACGGWGPGLWNSSQRNDLYNRGFLFIQASGNTACPDPPYCPCDPTRIGTGDVHNEINVSSINPTGNCDWSGFNHVFDVSAQGACLVRGERMTYGQMDPIRWTDNNLAVLYSGTSLACQVVAGVAGLLQSYSDLNSMGWTNHDLMYRIIQGSKKYGPDYFPQYAKDGYTPRPGHNDPPWQPMGVGRLDAYKAISLEMDNVYGEIYSLKPITDPIGIGPGNHDGYAEAGETVGLFFSIYNTGGPIPNASFHLYDNDSYVSIVGSADVQIGNIPAYSFADNSNNPFIISVSNDAPPGHFINVGLEIIGDNFYYNADNIDSIQIALGPLYDPISMNYAGYNPLYADINADGLTEIVNRVGGTVKAINASNGSILWSQTITALGALSAGDFDGDGTIEVITQAPDYEIYVLNGENGTIQEHGVIGGGSYVLDSNPLMVDWDGDGDLDYIFNRSRDLYICKSPLSSPENPIFRQYLPGEPWGMAAGDIDGGGKPDLIVTGLASPGLWVYSNEQQSIMPITSGPPPLITTAALGDVDDDGILDIIIAEQSSGQNPTGKMMRFYSDGQVPSTLVGEQIIPELGNYYCYPSVGDVDNDNIPEIAFYEMNSSKFYLADANGPLAGWPITRSFLPEKAQPLIADISGEGTMDVIFQMGHVVHTQSLYLRYNYLTGFSLDALPSWGTESEQMVLVKGSQVDAFKYPSPIIGDFDDNGNLDIGLFTGTSRQDGIDERRLEVWKTNSNYNNESLEWTQFQHDERNSGLYAQPVGLLYVSEDMTIWDDMVIWDGIDVEPGVTLTIKPGVNLKFKPSAYLTVRGNLNALGTVSDPIIFSCASPYPNERWNGINVDNNSIVHLFRCSIKDASFGIRALSGTKSSVTIENTTIDNIHYTGILDYYGNITISNSQVSNCADAGLELHNGLLNMQNNILANAGSYGIKIYNASKVDSSFILNNQIYRSSKLAGSIGILCDHSDKVSIRENMLSGFDQAGMRFQYSSPNIKKNTVHDINYNGLFFANSSSPNGVQRNEVFNVQRAAWCETGSYPIFGRDLLPSDWGNNSFHHFTKPPIENHNNIAPPPPIYAQRNWWGAPSCPTFTTNVICNPPLTLPPLGRISAPEAQIPDKFALHQNYPNPFNSSTTIKFDLPQASYVTIRVFNILGQEVARPHDGYLAAGYRSLIWDGRNSSGETVSSGIYLYNIIAGDCRETKKMTIVK